MNKNRVLHITINFIIICGIVVFLNNIPIPSIVRYATIVYLTRLIVKAIKRESYLRKLREEDDKRLSEEK